MDSNRYENEDSVQNIDFLDTIEISDDAPSSLNSSHASTPGKDGKTSDVGLDLILPRLANLNFLVPRFKMPPWCAKVNEVVWNVDEIADVNQKEPIGVVVDLVNTGNHGEIFLEELLPHTFKYIAYQLYSSRNYVPTVANQKLKDEYLTINFNNRLPSESNDYDSMRSDARLIAERIMDIFSNVNISSNANKQETDEDSVKSSHSKNPAANYYYLMFIQQLAENQMRKVKVPQQEFRLKASLTLALALLEESSDENNDPANKGLALGEKVVDEYDGFISSEIAEAPVFFPLLDKLSNLVAFCADKETRTQSITLLSTLTSRLSPKWRSKVIQWVFDNSKHDSLYGYYVTLLKDSVSLALVEKDQEMIAEFSGSNLCLILNKICRIGFADNQMPGGSLLEHSNSIISTLNLLIYLYIRDGEPNQSGFQAAMKDVAEAFLDPLKAIMELICMQFERGQELLNEIPEDEDVSHMKREFTLIINGKESFPEDISLEEQLGSTQLALFTFDLISHLLKRIEECRCSPSPATSVPLVTLEVEN